MTAISPAGSERMRSPQDIDCEAGRPKQGRTCDLSISLKGFAGIPRIHDGGRRVPVIVHRVVHPAGPGGDLTGRAGRPPSPCSGGPARPAHWGNWRLAGPNPSRAVTPKRHASARRAMGQVLKQADVDGCNPFDSAPFEFMLPAGVGLGLYSACVRLGRGRVPG
jgi:hypothetical protein